MSKSYKRNNPHKPRAHGHSFDKKKKGEWKKPKWSPEPPIVDQVDGVDET